MHMHMACFKEGCHATQSTIGPPDQHVHGTHQTSSAPALTPSLALTPTLALALTPSLAPSRSSSPSGAANQEPTVLLKFYGRW